jgi:hypothetical protein
LNQRRTIAGDPVTSAYLALRIGEVFFGSIGSEQGLDFTVVAPGGERGQSDRCDVPVGRTERAGLFRIRRGAATAEKAKPVFLKFDFLIYARLPDAQRRCAARSGSPKR